MLSLAMMSVNEDLLFSWTQSGRPAYRIYEPESVSIVLGAGRKNKGDIIHEHVERDGIPVLRRRGGGGTAVLSPGMVVLAVVREVDSPFHNREYALEINGWFKKSLSALGVAHIQDLGICDLALGGKKILGASLFRRRLLLFYQSSLLVCNNLALFSRYLTYPSSVPAYRAGRSHEEFCTNLHNAGYIIPTDRIIQKLEETISEKLPVR
jgi:lipoate-protein ligase A